MASSCGAASPSKSRPFIREGRACFEPNTSAAALLLLGDVELLRLFLLPRDSPRDSVRGRPEGTRGAVFGRPEGTCGSPRGRLDGTRGAILGRPEGTRGAVPGRPEGTRDTLGARIRAVHG